MTIKPDDQRLTAYALGELESEESAQIEALLKENPSMVDEVAAIRETASLLENELTADSTLQLSDEQRSRVIAGGDEPGEKIVNPGPDAFSRTSRWLGITAAAACVMAVSAIGIKQFLFEEKQAVMENTAKTVWSPATMLKTREPCYVRLTSLSNLVMTAFAIRKKKRVRMILLLQLMR